MALMALDQPLPAKNTLANSFASEGLPSAGTSSARTRDGYNWWAPRSLKWLWERIGFQEEDGLPILSSLPVGAGD